MSTQADVHAVLPHEHGLHDEEFPEECPHGWYLRAYCPVQATDTRACAKCCDWKPGNGRSGKGQELNQRAWTAQDMFDTIVRHLMGNAHKMAEQDAFDMAFKEVLGAFNNGSDWVERVPMSADELKWWLSKEAKDKGKGEEQPADKGSGKGKKGKGKDGEQHGVKRPRIDGAGSGQAAAAASGELAAAVASIGQSLSEAVAGALQPLQQHASASRSSQQLQLMRAFAPAVNVDNDLTRSAIEIHGAARKLAKMARMTSELCEREADKIESILTGLGVMLPHP